MDTTDERVWLTRQEIDHVLSQMSAADIIEGLADGANQTDGRIAGRTFDAAAERLGLSNGTPAIQHVRLQDFRYLVKQVMETMRTDSPLSEGQSD